MKLLSILLFLVIAVSIFLVAVLINPDQLQNTYFWITLTWLITLTGLNWFASTFMFIGASHSDSNTRTFGILPSLNIIVFLYSLISATLLISTWYLNDFGMFPNSHLVLQIILFSVVASIAILMFIAAKAAEVENVNVSINKEELTKILKSIQSIQDLSSENKALIKELIELVRYSIPNLSNLNSNDNYEKLSLIFLKTNFKMNKDLNQKEIENAIYLAKNC
jgi:hypothetical protein